MSITEFLLARITEDEQAARYAMTRDALNDKDTEGWWIAHYQHYTRYHPERVLAECEAKRGIVEACTEPGPDDEDAGMQDWEGDLRGHAELMLCLLASVYADHPDYRDEWQV